MKLEPKLKVLGVAWSNTMKEAARLCGTEWEYLNDEIKQTETGAEIVIKARTGQLTAPQVGIAEQRLPANIARIAKDFGIGVSEIKVEYVSINHPTENDVYTHTYKVTF